MIDWRREIANGNLVIKQWLRDRPRIGCGIVYKSIKGNDHAFGERTLNRLKEAMRTGALDEACVLFVRRTRDGLEFIHAATLEVVAKLIERLVIYDGTFGRFWWINVDQFEDARW